MADRTVRVSLVAQVNGYLAGMDQARRKTQDMAGSAENLEQKFQKQNDAMEKTGRAITAMGAVAAAGLALTAKAAIDWETAWAGVTKTVDATPDQLADIEKGLRGLARELPASHEQIAAVAEAAGQLGVKSADVVAFTKTMVNLGETTNLTADEAATSIAQLMNIMKTSPKDVDRLGAALVDLGNNGASTERDIIFMAQRIAGAGQVIGLTEAQVLGFANALASVGIEVEAGGSAISSIMIDIGKSVATGGEKLDKFASVAGISASDFTKSFKDDPAEAITEFVEGLGRINDAGGNVFGILSDLGQSDIRVTRALLSMAGSGDLLRKSLELGDKAWASNTALTAEAEKRYDTVAAKLDIARNKIVDVAISIGQTFLPMIEGASEAVGGFADFLGGLPAPLQSLIAVVGGVGAAALLSGGLFLLAVPKIAEYKLALDTLAGSSMPGLAKAAAGVQLATSRASATMAATAKFLTGPWGIAVAAAVVGVKLLADYMKSLQATSAELTNSLTTAKTAAQVFDTLAKGRSVSAWADIRGQLEDLPSILAASADQSSNFLSRFTGREYFGAFDALHDLGDQLATTAATDLPEAQRQFKLLADETDGSDKSLWRLANTLGGGYMDALRDAANQQGINVTSSDEAANKAALLKLALGDIAEEAPKAATGLEQVTVATEGSQEAVDKWLEMVSESDAAFISLQGAYDGLIKKNQDVAQSTADSTKSADDSWQDYYDGQSVNIADYLTELQGQVDAQTNWETNMLLLAGRVSQGTLDELARMGPEGAPLVAQLVTASDGELSQLDDVFAQRTSDATGAFADTLNSSGAVVKAAAAQLGQDTANEIARKLASGEATVEQIIKDYGIKIGAHPPTTTAVVNPPDLTAAEQALVRLASKTVIITAKLNLPYSGYGGADYNPNTPYATGGYVAGPGTGTSDSIPARLSNGEYVVNAAATQRNRALLEAINSGTVRGYASGGMVQYAPRAHGPSAGGPGTSSVPQFNVVVQSKGGVDLLKYVDVRVEASDKSRDTASSMGWSVNR